MGENEEGFYVLSYLRHMFYFLYGIISIQNINLKLKILPKFLTELEGNVSTTGGSHFHQVACGDRVFECHQFMLR